MLRASGTDVALLRRRSDLRPRVETLRGVLPTRLCGIELYRNSSVARRCNRHAEAASMATAPRRHARGEIHGVASGIVEMAIYPPRGVRRETLIPRILFRPRAASLNLQ